MAKATRVLNRRTSWLSSEALCSSRTTTSAGRSALRSHPNGIAGWRGHPHPQGASASSYASDGPGLQPVSWLHRSASAIVLQMKGDFASV